MYILLFAPSAMCACGMTNSCYKADTVCECDANDDVMREDSGYLTYKDDLPIVKFQAGDTGQSNS